MKSACTVPCMTEKSFFVKDPMLKNHTSQLIFYLFTLTLTRKKSRLKESAYAYNTYSNDCKRDFNMLAKTVAKGIRVSITCSQAQEAQDLWRGAKARLEP